LTKEDIGGAHAGTQTWNRWHAGQGRGGRQRRWRRRRRRRRRRWWRRCPAPRAHHRDERRWRARQAAAEPHAIQLRRAEGDVPHQQVLHLAREHRVAPVALAHVQVRAAHRQREAHRRRRRDAHTAPVDLGGPVGVGEARTRLHDRDVSPHVCGERRRACIDFGEGAPMKHMIPH
jgi:hypothetical protein